MLGNESKEVKTTDYKGEEQSHAGEKIQQTLDLRGAEDGGAMQRSMEESLKINPAHFLSAD